MKTKRSATTSSGDEDNFLRKSAAAKLNLISLVCGLCGSFPNLTTVRCCNFLILWRDEGVPNQLARMHGKSTEVVMIKSSTSILY